MPKLREGFTKEYWKGHPERMKKRSKWDLLIVPLGFVISIFLAWKFYEILVALRPHFNPKDSFFVGSVGWGEFFLLPIFPITLIMGFMIINVIAYNIPFLRKAFDKAAEGNKHLSFNWNMIIFAKLLLITILIASPFLLIGTVNDTVSLSNNGIYYRPLFSIHPIQYKWNDVKEVDYSCQWSKSYNFTQNFILADGQVIQISPDYAFNLWDRYTKWAPLLTSNIKQHFYFDPECVDILKRAYGVHSQFIQNIQENWSF